MAWSLMSGACSKLRSPFNRIVIEHPRDWFRSEGQALLASRLRLGRGVVPLGFPFPVPLRMRSPLGGAVLGIKICDRIHKRDMRKGLGEIANQAFFLSVILLGEQPHV